MLQTSTPHSPLAQAAYRALLASLAAEPELGLRGVAICKSRGGGRFWYDSYRVGASVKSRYLGPDSSALQEKLRAHAEQRAAFAVRQQERRSFVRFLQAERVALIDGGTGSFLSAFSALGGFRHGAVLMGEPAFELSALELGCRLTTTQQSCLSRSVPSCIPLAALEPVDEGLYEVTGELKLRASVPFDPVWPLSWPSASRDVRITYLTPRVSPDGTPVWPLSSDDYRAPPLMKFLIEQSIAAALPYRHGVLLRIPRPERFALHALLMAHCHAGANRTERAATDLDQATALLDILIRDRPDDLRAAWAIAAAQWPDLLQASLSQAPWIRDRLDTADITI
ncbi:GSU2403 family nucleotidyltransferase fold protein [Aestuariivirga sp.]|uniref:GSU2403 family nucleotidyltransferase fold protein n=1 Tax=Aestuariivirga sp. TaxID=2650926 RepID=UPI003593685D